MQQPKRIVIRTPNWIGDHVMATDFYRSMRRYYANSHLCFLSPPVLKDFPDQDLRDEKVIFLRERGLKQMAEELRQRNFDLAVQLPSSFSSSFLFWLAGIPVRTGFAESGAELFLTSFVRWDGRAAKKHKSELYADLFSFLSTESIASVNPEIDSGSSLQKKIVLAPGASIPLREWPYFQELIHELERNYPNYQIQVVGTDDKWKALVGKRIDDKIGKTTLEELIHLCRSASLVIANDSGVSHLAATLANAPTLVLFGPGDPDYIAPKGKRVFSSRLSGLRCSPCEKPYCTAPYGYQTCLRKLSVASVFEQVQRALSV